MKKSSTYDKKSHKTVLGKTADFQELAKGCVAFANAKGEDIDIGIEDNDELPPKEQKINDGLWRKVRTTKPASCKSFSRFASYGSRRLLFF